jgi:hypothetical protein
LALRDKFRVSDHALREVHKEGLRAKDILYAIFNGRIIENYPNRKRVLILGPIKNPDLILHVVCDYSNREELVAVTVYIPNRPKWHTASTRGTARIQ